MPLPMGMHYGTMKITNPSVIARVRAMINAIPDITIYPEDRPCSVPSAKRIPELVKGVTRHHLIDGEGTS